jgi:predicted ATPase/tetratricopeptide (TPR) repeat protein
VAPLATFTEPESALRAIAQALRVEEQMGVGLAEALCRRLKGKEALLVLDNLEQVREIGPMLVSIVECCPTMRVLATSRFALHIFGEDRYPLAPMAVPPAADGLDPRTALLSPAVQLFVRRARQASPDFELTEANVVEVARICQLLDGLPLALELVAARLSERSAAQILSDLSGSAEQGAGPARPSAQRLQPLRGVMDWSCGLLPAGEREILGLMSVFAGGCDLEALVSVASEGGISRSAALYGASSLVDKSLLQREVPSRGIPRLSMLQTVRQYSLEHLEHGKGAEPHRRAHASYYLRLAEDVESFPKSTSQPWLDRLGVEYENLLAAAEWALVSEPPTALRLAVALGSYWDVRSYWTEGRDLLARAMAVADGPRVALAWGLYWSGHLAYRHGDYDSAQQFLAAGLESSKGVPLLSAALLNGMGRLALVRNQIETAWTYLDRSLAEARLSGDRREEAMVLTELGSLASSQDDLLRARQYGEDALALWRRLDDAWGLSRALNGLGYLEGLYGRRAEARRYYEESLTYSRKLGDRVASSVSLSRMGILSCLDGDYQQARRHLDESIRMLGEEGDRRHMANALDNLANVAEHEHGYAEAYSLRQQCLGIRQQTGHRLGITGVLEGLGRVALFSGQPGRALTLFGAACSARISLAAPMPRGIRGSHHGYLRRARVAAGAELAHRSWRAGRNMDLDSASAYAMEPLES